MENSIYHNISKIKELIDKANKIAIFSHFDPDGDAVGSVLALSHYLEKEGKSTMIFLPNNCPEFLKWMPGCEKIIVYNNNQDIAIEQINKCDLFIFADFNDFSRLKKLAKPLGEIAVNTNSILIDHHPNPSISANIVISNTMASSTAELVYEFIINTSSPEVIDVPIATCIFAGIMTDTGCFSYNSSNPRTFDIISHLLAQGIDKDDIYKKIYENYSEQRMRLMGYCLNNKMIILEKYNTAYIGLTREELKKYKFSTGDTEGFVNLPFSIKGIKFTALFIEKEGFVRLSLRSKDGFYCNVIAEKYFKGGGHQYAAGGVSDLSLNDTIKKFEDLLPNYADALK